MGKTTAVMEFKSNCKPSKRSPMLLHKLVAGSGSKGETLPGPKAAEAEGARAERGTPGTPGVANEPPGGVAGLSSKKQ